LLPATIDTALVAVVVTALVAVVVTALVAVVVTALVAIVITTVVAVVAHRRYRAVIATALVLAVTDRGQRHAMSFNFSVKEDAPLFGLNVGLDEHLHRLEAAKAFTYIRKDIDRNITTLRTMTPSTFTKRRNNAFKENVELVVNGAPGSRVLIPFVEKLGSNDSDINIFILVCFTLSGTTYTKLETHNLTEVFAELLTHIVDDCTIFSNLRAKFINIIKDICRKNNNETSNKILGLFSL
jgi:hypothetical protein